VGQQRHRPGRRKTAPRRTGPPRDLEAELRLVDSLTQADCRARGRGCASSGRGQGTAPEDVDPSLEGDRPGPSP
jgi:hypothetical protein